MTARELRERFDDVHTHGRTGPRLLTSVEPREARDGEAGQAWYSVGIHPWSTAAHIPDDDFRLLEEAVDDPRVAAIGECGLDALCGGSAEFQEAVFRRHVELSERAGLPLIVHCVRRYGRIMELRRELKPLQPWIIHGFRGNAETARQITSRGIYLSLGEKFNPDAILNIPPHLLLAETDESHTSINSIAAAISPADPTLPFNNLKRLLSTCNK